MKILNGSVDLKKKSMGDGHLKSNERRRFEKTVDDANEGDGPNCRFFERVRKTDLRRLGAYTNM